MNEQERIAKFAEEFAALQQKYGVSIKGFIVAASETWPPPANATLTVRIECRTIDNWQAPETAAGNVQTVPTE
jgi:hypothetical protein